MEPCTAKRLGEKGNHLLSMEKLENSGIVFVLWRDLMLEFAGAPRSREKDPLREKFVRRYQSLMWEAGISTGSFYLLAGFPLGYQDWSRLLGWRNGDGGQGEVVKLLMWWIPTRIPNPYNLDHQEPRGFPVFHNYCRLVEKSSQSSLFYRQEVLGFLGVFL